MTPQNAASHLGLFCLHREILSKNEINYKNHTYTPKIESGLTQLIMMGEYIRQIWVKCPVLHSVNKDATDKNLKVLLGLEDILL